MCFFTLTLLQSEHLHLAQAYLRHNRKQLHEYRRTDYFFVMKFIN